jgi:formylmethanofuran dehydrogenase subunit B
VRGATVAFTTATYGINTGGTVYRMDDVPIPLRPAFESPYPSDQEVLSRLETRIREMQRPKAETFTIP